MTIDRSRLILLRREPTSDSDSDDEMEWPRSHSLPTTSSRNVRTIEQRRHAMRRNRNAPQFAVLSVGQPQQPQHVQEVAETEEEG